MKITEDEANDRVKSASTSPTIQDIAHRVGVSKGAVSVVLNGANSSTRVSALTRQRILDVAESLNYRPNVAAQALTRGRMDTIGIMFGFSSGSITSRSLAIDILNGVTIAAERANKNLMLFTQSGRTDAKGTRRISDQRTDGIVVVMPRTEGGMIADLLAQRQPIVFIGYPGEKHQVSSVDVDHESGAVLAVEHLLQLGHRRIAHIQGDDFYICTGQRTNGFLQTMLAAGIVPPPEYIINSSYTGIGVEEHTRYLLSLPDPPTAIFAGNDIMAMQVIRTANAMGFLVPAQLSVIGFDDVAFSAMSESTMTTVRQPFAEMGEQAAELLLRRLNGESVSAETLILKHELVVRQTTAPPSE